MDQNSLVIVAIDDQVDNLVALSAVLADVLPGADVKSATNGRQGIELARTADPDVILLDIVMPGMDGFEVCRRLKGDEHLRHIPVLFLTALRSDRDSRIRAIEVGAEGFLTKPIEEAEVIAQIRAMARIKAANVSRRREQERLAALVAERTRELEQELVVRRNAEAALRESEEKFRSIAEQLSDSIFLMDERGVITYISPAAESVFGRTPDEMTGYHFRDFVAETSLPSAIAAFDGGMTRGIKVSDLQLRMKRPDGTTFVGELTASRTRSGPETGSLGVVRDISGRVQTETALADERRLLRTVIDNLPDAVYAKDMDLRKTLANRAELELIDAASESDVLGKTDIELFPPEVAERSMADDSRVLQTGQPMVDHEELLVDARGKSRWQLTSTFPLFDDAGRTIGLVGIGRDITERKQADEVLAGERRLLRTVIDNLPDPIYAKDIHARKIAANRADVENIGAASESDVLGKTDLELFPPEVAERLVADDHRVLQTGQPIRDHEELFVDAMGRSRWLSTSKFPLFDDAGRTIGLVGIGRDITERKQADEVLAGERRLLRTVIDNLPDAVYAKDMQARKTLANRAELGLIGAASELDVLGKTDLESYPPEVAERFMAVDWRVLRTEQAMLEQETLFVDGRGESRWLLTSKYPLKDDAGQIVGLVGIGRDITERKQAEEALADERRLLRTVIDNLPDAIYAKDMHARKIVANRADVENIGAASESDVLGKTDLELFPPEVAERLVADDQRVLQTGQPMPDHEELLVDTRGRSRWLLTSKFPLKDDAGQTVGLVGIGHDITERKQAEAERTRLVAQIEAQARQVRQIIDTVPQGMVLLDANGRVLLSNPVAERDMALLARGSADRLSGLGDVPLAELLTSLPGQPWHEVQAGGRVFEVISRPIPGDPERWVLVIDDVTLERQARDELQRQEQLAAIGQLAAGIAHDFSNIMAVIVLYAQMISGQTGLPPQAREKADVIHAQAYRATDLIQQILDFSRRAPMERQPMQLLPLLKEVIRLWERTLPESIRIELVRDDSACRISADPTRIQQVLMNLATNARDAMPEGGSLRIELRQVAYDVNTEAPVPTMAAGEWVRLDFTDTGTGMPPDVMSHLFEPFYTTKAPGEGTGLGLAQAHGIIKQHDGEILVKSAPGQGTTFSIYLPALPVNQTREATKLEAGSLPQGSGQTILVVEDNAATRAALVGALEMLAYRVLPAPNGEEALAIYASHQDEGVGPVNLIISDLTMPDMGGKALASALRKLGATVPLVILSGNIGDDDIRELADLGAARCLRKPLDLSELARVVAEVLG